MYVNKTIATSVENEAIEHKNLAWERVEHRLFSVLSHHLNS